MEILVIPHIFKKVGWIVLLLCIPIIFVLRELGFDPSKNQSILSMLGLVGFMMVILSAQKNENEGSKKLRTKLLAISFINIIVFTFVEKLFCLLGIFENGTGSIFSNPMGLIYFSAIMYFFFYMIYSDDSLKNVSKKSKAQ